MYLDAATFVTGSLIASGRLAIGDGYRAKNSELSVVGIPFARAGNIDNGFQFDGADKFPEEDLAKVGEKISRPGDVVITSKGTVGRLAFVHEKTPRFVFSPQLCYWRCLDVDFIDPKYLYYWMYGREFWGQASAVKGETDMADYVSLTAQRRMKITLPVIEIQREIREVLGAFDDKIELNRQMSHTLEAMMLAIFRSWFIDFDPVIAKAEGLQPNGMNANTVALFPSHFVESEMGPIPEGWRGGRIGDIAENRRSGVKPGAIAPETPYIGLEHMPRRSVALTKWGTAQQVNSGKYNFEVGDILFGKLRPYFHKVGIAPVTGVCSTDILVVKPNEHKWFGFTLGHLSSSLLKKS